MERQTETIINLASEALHCLAKTILSQTLDTTKSYLHPLDRPVEPVVDWPVMGTYKLVQGFDSWEAHDGTRKT